MNTDTHVCQSPTSFQSATQFSGPATADSALQRTVDALAQYWHDRHVRTRQSHSIAAMAAISAHTLKDIGAPNWMVAEALTRDDGHSLRLIDLYRS
ncbi:MAG: hypothetical protein ABI831_02215 [Betaproteobacteria bacterium]